MRSSLNMKIYYALFALLVFASACETESMMSDIEPPVIEIFEPIDTTFALSGESFSIFGRVTDNQSLAQLTFKSNPLGLNGLILPSDFDEPSGGTFNITIEIDELTPDGTYDVELTAFDLAGNTARLDLPLVVNN